MAVIITKENTTFSGTNNFYGIESYNLGTWGATNIALRGTISSHINITFANAGNCQGVVLSVATTSTTDSSFEVSLQQIQTVTSFDLVTEKINKVAHGLNDLDRVSFTSTGTLPTGISSGTLYYVRNKTDDDFQISITETGAISLLSGTPTGVCTVGVDRASKVTSKSEMFGGVSEGVYLYRNDYIKSFTFTTPYAVDTNANKWRIRVGTDSAVANAYFLHTSNNVNPFYAVWCDNLTSFSDGDVVIVKNKLVIDKSLTLGAVLGVGEATSGVSCIICSNTEEAGLDTVALMEWENEPTASYTFGYPGRIMMGAFSGFRVGTSTKRIPFTKRAILKSLPAVVGTQPGRFSSVANSVIYNYGGSTSLFFYGEIPTYQFTTLKEDADINQKVIKTTNSVDWLPGDKIVIGKKLTQGQGDLTIYTIDTVVGDTITLLENIKTHKRIAGGTVIKLDSHGILLTAEGNGLNYATNNLYAPANFIFDGVDCLGQVFNNTQSSYYMYASAVLPQYTSQHKIVDCTFWSISDSSSYFLTDIVSHRGTLFERVYTDRTVIGYTMVAYYAYGYKSGRLEMKNCRLTSLYSATLSQTANIRITVEDCFFENGRASYNAPLMVFTGINGIWKNNTLWGSGNQTNTGATRVDSCINPLEISGNKYDNCNCAIGITALTNIGCIDEGSIFGSEVTNTTEISLINPGAFPDYLFKNSVGIVNINFLNIPEMAVGGRIGFENYNSVATDDKMYYSLGITQRTNASLTDTTVRTAGGSALRIEPIGSERFEFDFDVPTGNIQNKTMSVSVWVKINNSLFYSGESYELPRLNVTYDGKTTIYSQALPNTNWQLLSVSFTPTTTTGSIKVVLSGLSDAIGSDSYFYFDDMAILYPAGYQLNLGGLDEWTKALPVLPPIATNVSAADVWNFPIAGLTATGTTGKKLKDGFTVADSQALL